jgi:Raf kinase inhibitor-like YbhB/YbcL family protein
MQIKVLHLVNGYLNDKYDKHAPSELQRNGVPFVSFPIEFSDLPQGTGSLALTLIDYDAVPVCGFPWIHWLAANITPTIGTLPENASDNHFDPFIQGSNSWNSLIAAITDTKITQQYGGPTPPDKDHDYTLVVYALDQKLALKDGYYLNEFYKLAKHHVLAQTDITIKSGVHPLA